MEHTHVPIHLRNSPEQFEGKSEIIDHAFLISYFCKWYRPKLYLEYGVRGGDCVKQQLPYCQHAWGVDIDPIRINDHKFTGFQMTTRDFKRILDKEQPIIDIVFIDACHESETVVHDFADVFPYVIDDGLIFLHDTYPMDRKFTHPNHCNDCWKVPSILEEKYGHKIQFITIPIQPGLTIVKKTRIVSLPWMA